MKQIDKSVILSKDFKSWHNSLEHDKHPPYNASHRYYFDLKMSLLYTQDGLCAYTEQRLCDTTLLQMIHWDEHKYIKNLSIEEKQSIQGDLEHFDESLKEKNGWLWDNLFVVSTHANCRIKGKKSIDYMLKPDKQDYDPHKYLEFDYETGFFIPKHDLNSADKDKVKYMIETLGINCIYAQRKKRLKEWKDRIEVGLAVEPDEYITAWSMIK